MTAFPEQGFEILNKKQLDFFGLCWDLVLRTTFYSKSGKLMARKQIRGSECKTILG